LLITENINFTREIYFTGQKGIGFKSVFRITDAPEVHSNGFHIKFDVNSGPMGYILPHWVPDKERLEQNELVVYKYKTYINIIIHYFIYIVCTSSG
jgi:hypothetical protein